MTETEHHSPASSEVQIDSILNALMLIQGKLQGSKDILKHYKIKSERLTQLKRAKKELGEQIAEEKDRIESEYYEDKDYEQAKNDQLTYKNEIKEKKSELGVILHSKYKAPTLQTEEHIVNGEPVKLQLQFIPDIYINGRSLK